MIVFSHAMPSNNTMTEGYIDLSLATNDIERLVLVFAKYGGQIGNCIFVVCSAWFLVDNYEIRTNKILNLISDSFALSILGLVLFSLIGVNLSAKEIVKQFFPLLFRNNWFLVCYLCYYMIHPMLNWTIGKLSKLQLFETCLVLIVIYSILASLIEGAFYSNALISFCMIHFCIAFIKKYMQNLQTNIKINITLLVLCFVGLIFLVLLTNSLGMRFPAFSNKVTSWCSFRNPMIIIIAISAFNLVRTIKIESKAINALAKLSLPIYLIHANYIMQVYGIGIIFYGVLNITGSEVLSWFSSGLILLTYGILGAVLYHSTLQKIIYRIDYRIGDICHDKLNYIMGKITHIIN